MTSLKNPDLPGVHSPTVVFCVVGVVRLLSVERREKGRSTKIARDGRRNGDFMMRGISLGKKFHIDSYIVDKWTCDDHLGTKLVISSWSPTASQQVLPQSISDS